MTHKPIYAEMTAFERSREIGQAMAALDITRRIVTGLESMYRRAGTSTQCSIYAIQAATHLGKSTAQRIFMIQKAAQLGGYTENVREGLDDFSAMPDVSYVTVENPDGTFSHPVVRIEVHANPTVKALIKHVARALTRGAEELPEFDAKDIKNGNMNDVTAFFTRHLRAKGVKLIIFDDVQEIGRVVGAQRNGAVVLFKTLCKTGRVQVACAGIEGTIDVLASDEQTSHLTTKRHIFEPLPRPIWEGKDFNAPNGDFATFLRSMEKQLPFDEPSGIDKREIAEPMWEYCKGVIGLAKTLLQEATDYAIHQNKSCLDRQLFSDVLTHELDLDDEHNPFFVPAEVEVAA